MKPPPSHLRLHLTLWSVGMFTAASAAVTPPPDLTAPARPFAEGIISTPESFGASFSPDGRTFYFARALPPRGLPTILCSHLCDGQWTEPEIVPIDGASGEGDASLSPDGARLFFWSRRTAPGKPAGSRPIPDLWFAEQRDGRFGPAHSVGETDTAAWTPLSLRFGGPSVAADGTLYAFRGAAATGGPPRLVRAPLVSGRYLAFEDLGEGLNANGGGFDPYVAPDQHYLVFSSDRADSHGNADLYLSLRAADGSWSIPRNLGPAVNSDAAEYEPAISPDGRLLVFTRERLGIFVIEVRALGLDLSPEANKAARDVSPRAKAVGNDTPATLRAELVGAAACAGVRPPPEATLFEEGLISTPDSFAATFTPDGATLYFCRSSGVRPDRRSRIMESHYADGRWSVPQPVPFSGEFNDFDPNLSPDGEQLFFASVRPESGPRPALWVVERTAAGWSAARSLGTIAGMDGVTVFPCPTASGNLYFAGHATGLASHGDDDIYVCRRHSDGRYGPPENLGPAVNSPFQDYDGYVAPNESFIIFCSRRPGGIGPSDFYVSTRENGGWSAARNLGPLINSASVRGVCCPSVSPDRRWFYFTSSRNERPGIYRIEFKALGLASRASAAAPAAPAPRSAGGQAAPAPELFGGGAVKAAARRFLRTAQPCSRTSTATRRKSTRSWFRIGARADGRRPRSRHSRGCTTRWSLRSVRTENGWCSLRTGRWRERSTRCDSGAWNPRTPAGASPDCCRSRKLAMERVLERPRSRAMARCISVICATVAGHGRSTAPDTKTAATASR
ncbi:PD40 domain-containing protein [Opitutus terrae]|uniref:WD40 domain protein beta Propeller n=1 Tax=Opitutus terrae (strain DSM 11246 / JCM 15787 / PB90-1) TaxID=452637 RepID=B1ZX17_OPITP|nr:PD40 domain-containing protein [Opitutus terrae]ACB75128.1 WD40 domain protein beta Propeller [Opitutus terrae PB90-1]